MLGGEGGATLIRLAAADKDSRVLQGDPQIYLWVVDGSPEEVATGARRSDGNPRPATPPPQAGQRLIGFDLGATQRRRVARKCNQPATETTTETTRNTTSETAENLRELMAAST